MLGWVVIIEILKNKLCEFLSILNLNLLTSPTNLFLDHISAVVINNGWLDLNIKLYLTNYQNKTTVLLFWNNFVGIIHYIVTNKILKKIMDENILLASLWFALFWNKKEPPL